MVIIFPSDILDFFLGVGVLAYQRISLRNTPEYLMDTLGFNAISNRRSADDKLLLKAPIVYELFI